MDDFVVIARVGVDNYCYGLFDSRDEAVKFAESHGIDDWATTTVTRMIHVSYKE